MKMSKADAKTMFDLIKKYKISEVKYCYEYHFDGWKKIEREWIQTVDSILDDDEREILYGYTPKGIRIPEDQLTYEKQ